MPSCYSLAALFLLALAGLPLAARAQAPVITAVAPLANARAAARTVPLTVTFSQPLVAGSAAALQVFSQQRGGRRTAATPATSSGNSLVFAPPAAATYKPGETVQYTVTTAAAGSGGALAQPRVGQFTTATSGTGQGNFSLSSAAFPGNRASGVASADVDGDGDLDLLALTGLDVVTVLLNNGSGTFATAQAVSVGWGATLVKVADVDGDGDLDLLTASYSAPNGGIGNTVSVRLNNGSGTFGGMQEVTVGVGPIDLAIGDVDGDGDLDFCTASGGTFTAPGTTVSVRLNNGSGTFAGTQNMTAGYRLGGVALGDVDADGDLDLLVADGNSYLSVFLNSGGTFGTRQLTSLNYTPVCLATGDVDGDGDLDVLSADNYGSAHIHLNTGTGAFSSGQALFIVNYPGQLVVGDVDADGDLDFLTASGKIFLNDGTGAFSQQQNLAFPSGSGASALADIDNDGDLDWLVPATYMNVGVPMLVFFNEPRVPVATRFVPASGVAGTSVALHGTNLTRLNALTVNGKAVPFSLASDTLLTFGVPAGASATQAVALAAPGNVGSTSPGFTVLLKVSGASPAANALAAPPANSAFALTFSEPIVATGALPTATAGLKAFSAQVGGRKAGTVSLSGATLNYASSLPAPRTAFRPGEVLSVSVPATIKSAGGLAAQKAVYQFTAAVLGGSGTFLPGTDPATGSGPHGVTTGDVDGDGDLDLLTADQYANTVSVRLNQGNGTFSAGPPVPVGQRPYDVAVGDVDGDGDLLSANYYDGTVSVRLNNGSGSFGGSQNVAAGYSPSGLALGDADADGDLDLFVSDMGGSAVHIRLNDGAGTFSGTQSVGSIYFPLSVAIGDLDGDGDLDFVASAASNVSAPNPLICVSLNDGNGGFSFPQYVNIGSAPLRVVLADVDQDGDLDFLASNLNAKVSVRLNNGRGTFGGTQEVAVGSNPYGLATGDVDADGDLDIVTANYGANGGGTVSVCLNNGQGTFGSGLSVSVGVHPQSLVLGDLDGDGDLDLATANSNVSGTLSVRLNQGQVLATTTSSPGGSFGLFPNPAASATQLTGAAPHAAVVVLDALGRPVLAARADASGAALLKLPAACAPGIYLVRSGMQVQRLLVE